jgi:hypothetical protein
MSTAIADTSGDIFVTAAEALRQHPHLSRVRLYRAAVIGGVQTQLIPGVPPRYKLADVEQLAKSGRRAVTVGG